MFLYSQQYAYYFQLRPQVQIGKRVPTRGRKSGFGDLSYKKINAPRFRLLPVHKFAKINP